MSTGMNDTTTWWLVIQSHDLLEHVRDAHSGVDPSDVLRNIYLEAEERENVRPMEEDEDLTQEREYRRQVEDDNKRLRAGLERIVASGAYPEAAIAQEVLDG